MILDKYNKILKDKYIKQFLCTSHSFFTSWSWILWLLCIIFKYILNINVPNFLMVSSQNFILACCIVGYYIMYVYGHNLIKKYKMLKQIFIDIGNNITHIIPFIIIIMFNKFETIKSINDLILSIVFSIIFCSSYLLTFKPEDIYSFTNWNKKKIISVGLIVYTSLFFIK